MIDGDWIKSRRLDGRRGGVLLRFAPMLHGLFLLGVELLPNGAAGLAAPRSPAFWPEYDEHVRSAGWTRPTPALEFDGEIASLAQIYRSFDGGVATPGVLPDLSFPDEHFPPPLLPFRPGSESRARFEVAKPADPFLAKLLQGSRPAGEL